MIMKRITRIAMAGVLALCCACGEQNETEKPDNGGQSGNQTVETEEFAHLYTTTSDKRSLFKESTVKLGSADPTSYMVTLTDEKFQTVDGFGAAMTWASCYNILKMTPENRTAFLKDLFDVKEGLGIGLIRVSIGASDFNIEEYTWCDKKGMENFAVDRRDRETVFPVLKEIYSINPDVKILASPWSCPRWMKRRSVTDNSDFYSWTSGSLKPEYYQDYATYFVKWIEAMQAEGFSIDMVTIQNEPLNHGNSMSLYMGWEEQRDFIKTALGPAFEKAGLKTKILVFDHNYNYDNVAAQKNYPLKIYKDAEASKYIAGSAWHNYGGNVSELDNIIANAPDKDIYFTEASIGTWNYDFAKCLLNDFRDIFMGTLKRGGKGVTLWNMVLDDNKGPYSPQSGSCKTCYGAVTLMSSSNTIGEKMSHYYNIAHASKVIRPGAVRIGTSGFTKSQISYQAFRNPDGSYGVIVLNEGSEDQYMVFASAKKSVKTTIPSKAIVSMTWKD